MEELARVRAHGMMLSLHSDICLPYLLVYGTEEQKRRWAPGADRRRRAARHRDDRAGHRLRPRRTSQTTARRDGDNYVLNGAKTFISNGQIGDLFVVVAKTDPHAQPAAQGISLILVEADDARLRPRQEARQARAARPGHQRALLRGLPRPGDATCSAREGQGFKMLMQKLQQERLVIAIAADRVVPARARRHDRVREGAPRVRHSRSPRSRTRSSSSPSWRPRSRSARRSSTGCWPRTCAATTSSPR